MTYTSFISHIAGFFDEYLIPLVVIAVLLLFFLSAMQLVKQRRGNGESPDAPKNLALWALTALVIGGNMWGLTHVYLSTFDIVHNQKITSHAAGDVLHFSFESVKGVALPGSHIAELAEGTKNTAGLFDWLFFNSRTETREGNSITTQEPGWVCATYGVQHHADSSRTSA